MPSSGSCGASTRGVIFNFGYLGTNKKQSTDPDPSCHKYPIPDDTPLPFGHRKIMPGQGNGPLRSHLRTALRVSGPVEGFGVAEHAAQPGLIFAQDADLEVRLPFRPGRGDLVGGAELESEPAVVPRVAEQRGQRLAESVSRAQDGVHERAAGAVPLVVRPDGQRAEREDGVLADMPPGAQHVADG